MRLIDRDKLDSFKFRSASERMDLPVDYMVGWNDAVDGIMCNALTVEAIPINWIEGKKKTLRYQRIDLDDDDVDTAWDLKMKIEALEELIDEWNERKEE